MGYPNECNLCIGINAGQHDDKPKLLVRPFRGQTPPYVMLVGKNPTLEAKQAKTVLELDNPDSPIYKFIFYDVLQPVGIKSDHIYATNLVKCTFLKEPKDFSPFFRNCRKYFEKEIDEIRPEILISFGKPTFQLIAKLFRLQDVNKRMEEVLGKKYQIRTQDRKISYIPCIRTRVKGWSSFKGKIWETFIMNLRETVTDHSLEVNPPS